ncbi:MAG: hypothetical protein L3K19_07655 [Thermoplasmata archaeon]|nr:hypothetical protein [Thermoplasmata archaeon]
MRTTTPSSLHDKHQALLAARLEAEAEESKLRREEEYLTLQVRQAQEQVRYYEGLLVLLRRDWGRSAALADLVRKLG